MHEQRNLGRSVLMVALCFLPLLFFMWILASGVEVSPWILVSFLLVCFFAMYLAMGSHMLDGATAAGLHEESSTSENAVPEDIILNVVDVFYPIESTREGDGYVMEGRLLLKPEAALEELERRFSGLRLKPLLQESGSGRPILVLLPDERFRVYAEGKDNQWVNVALFVATLATTTWAGATHQGIDVLQQPARVYEGLPYALALMLILGAHELGHYLAARRSTVAVSLPYFIPIPFALGTFGAFIRLKSLVRNRRTAFDIAVSGPIAGLLVAIPALIIGLPYSRVVADASTASMFMGGVEAGSSVLLAVVAKMTIGQELTEGHRLFLHPVAFAGWLGLLLTALNLIPVGQLDGGHIAHAMVGRHVARVVGVASLAALVVLGLFVWSGLLVWAVIIFLIAGTSGTPPVNDVTHLERGRNMVGVAAFAVLLLILVPVPHALYQTFGIYCPYV